MGRCHDMLDVISFQCTGTMQISIYFVLFLERHHMSHRKHILHCMLE